MSNQPTAAAQLQQAQQQLVNAYVQREQTRQKLEQLDTQIVAFTNLLAGAELGQRHAGETVPQSAPPVDNAHVAAGATPFALNP